MRLPLICLFATLFIFACGPGPDKPGFQPTDLEWEFSLTNPIDTGKRQPQFTGGDRFRIDGDTLLLQNEFTSMERKRLYVSAENVVDSVFSLVLEPQQDSSLLVKAWYQGSPKGEWLFEPAQQRYLPVPEGALTGKTFRFRFPDTDTLQVYFGHDEHLVMGMGEKEYFIAEREFTRINKSKVKGNGSSGWFSSYYTPQPLRGNRFYFRMSQDEYQFGRYQYSFGMDEDGRLVVSYLSKGAERYERQELPLLPVASIVPDSVSTAAFCERISTGKVRVDMTYPPADSSDVEYSYEEDYAKQGGLEIKDLNDLELSFNPDGEYFLLARNRLFQSGKWEFSPDRNYLITLGRDGGKWYHLPILACTDDYIDLRLPLMVKTREPRGTKLESYCLLDAYVRVER